jgi:exodeoxyribonuclease VII large subunit
VDLLILQGMAFLVAAVVAPPLFKRLGFGTAVGYLAAGLAIGPSGLGIFDDADAVLGVAQLGIVLLLFVIGLDTRLSRLVAMKGDILGIGLGQVALTTAALGAMVLAHRERVRPKATQRDLSRALPRADTLLDGPRQRLDVLSDRLPAALIRSVQLRRVALSDHAGALRPALLRRAIQTERRNLAVASDRLSLDRFRADLERKNRDLASLSRRLSDAGQRQVRTWRQRIEEQDRLRLTLGYEATLGRGYAVVRDETGEVLTTKAQAAKARALEIQFADGRLALGGKPAPKPGGKTPPPEQGSLL